MTVESIKQFNDKYAKLGHCELLTFEELLNEYQTSETEFRSQWDFQLEVKSHYRFFNYDYDLDIADEATKSEFWKDFDALQLHSLWELDGSGGGLVYGVLMVEISEGLIKSFELNRKYPQIVVKSEHVDSMDEVFDEMVRRFRPQIIEFLSVEPTKEDWDTYEGGVDEWWGLGSVMLCELCIPVQVTYHHDGLTITIGG